ncbi:zinc-ribbon domain-containing protein [Roseovarius ramblicola]|uniref:Zinc-ribbon domain-containing protein n=1 Tax=Roseovarius ramblicola TaxID=2022336 RepID=A0ABV5HWR0_9RHOB
MRLTCPNCGAQYEVPDAVIPVPGRDVQCSNCGTTWFQNHPDHTPAEPDMPAADPDPMAATETAADPEPKTDPQPSAARRIDPSVADILREEADRERAARAAEADGRIETQPDLGIGEPEPEDARRAREARDRMQRLRGDRSTDPSAAPPGNGARTDDPDDMFDEEEDERLDPGSRRNLFPDIDEINSSLSASDDVTGPLAPTMSKHTPPDRNGGGGFRAGFRLAVVSCVAALVVYLMAPRIAAIWPAAEAPLAQYVQVVDNMRAMLSATVKDLITRI